MAQFPVHKAGSASSNRGRGGIMSALKTIFIVEKLNNTIGKALLIGISVLIAIGVGYAGLVFGAIFLAVLLGIPVIFSIVRYPKFGITLLLILAHLLFFIGRLGVPGPLGTAMDGIQALLILGVLIKQKGVNNWQFFKGPITKILLIWIGYNILEVANPVTEARLAWIYTVRSVAIIGITYFVFLYNIRTVKFIRLLIKIWVALAFFAAAYAFKQEYFGFSDAEQAYLNSPDIENLLFIAGHWRKFSIYSDPVTFSYTMVVASILCISLITGTKKVWKKVVLGLITLFMLNCMLFSGTRGANVLLPVAMFMLAILKFNKYVLMAAIAGALGLAALIVVPTSNPTIVRFQTTFKPNNDPSYLVRKANQKRIQPYILTHPMGGGLGATGEWGKRFAPGSFLANFPPDSGYVRVAVELGSIGLFIFCTLMFVVLKTGINHYFVIKSPELKSYCMAAVLIVFAFNIGDFPQEAIVQYPSNITFYLVLALISITYRIDLELQGKQVNALPEPTFS